jgi:hypothetical protein
MELINLPTDPAKAQFSAYIPAHNAAAKSVAALHFGSMAELVSHVPGRKPTGIRVHDDTAWGDDAGFCGTPDMETATRYALEGWQEGAERARPLLEKVKAARPAQKKLVRWDVAGATPSVSRFLSGNPLNMRTSAMSRSHRMPVITLLSNWSSPWTVNAKVFESVAVAAAAICDRLEDAGYRVEIIAGRRCSSERGGETGHVADLFARIKAPQDAMDLSRVAFGIGHPSALRRLAFAVSAIHPAFYDATSFGQGMPSDFDKVDMPAGTFALPSNKRVQDACGADALKTFDFVVAELTKNGCPGLE